MRIAVTGASGEFGAAIVPALLRRGHDVVGISRSPHELPDSRYSHVPADVRDAAALEKAFQDVDCVVHLAWTTHPLHDLELTHSIDVGGTRAVVDAMGGAGVPRLVFASSVMSYGSNPDNPDRFSETDQQRPNPVQVYQGNKVEAEQVIVASGVDAVLVRATNIMDRHCTGVTQQGFAGPAVLGFKGGANTMQFIHGDDLARFYADSVEASWTGPVNLAAQDTVTMRELAEILGRRYVEADRKRAERMVSFLWERGRFPLDPGALSALAWFPIVDNSRLTRELGWEPAWTSRECAEDFAEWNREHVFLGAKRLEVPWRWPIGKVPGRQQDGVERAPAGPAEATGELDTRVDSRYNIFTSANTSEAFPGPMTPLSVELAHECLSAAGAQNADVLRLEGELRRILTHEQVAVIGHGIYANMSVVLAMANALPGNDMSAWEDMLFGGSENFEVPELDPIGVVGLVKRLPRLVAKGYTLDAEATRLADRAKAAQRSADYFAGVSTPRLRAELDSTRDRVASCWATAAQGAVFITAVMGAIEKQAGKKFAAQIRGGTEGLESAGIAQGTHDLAALARRDGALRADLRNRAEIGVAGICERHPAFGRRLDEVLKTYGHRGPQEGELSNAMFADDPARLVDTVAKLLDAPERKTVEGLAMGRRLRLLASIGAHFQRARERVRDATIRETHRYRLIARELGNRLVVDGVLDVPDDVFYLLRAEILDPPVSAKELVARRRAERDRLRQHRPPVSFTGSFEATASSTACELAAGESITGSGVSAGTAKGRVRVMTIDTVDELEPGDVLVAEFTDVGWTPFFSFAGAVVVDTGGEMSHAAVVAREFGVPCVVGTKNGSQVLKDGYVVEVDGAAGTITRVE